MNILFWNVQKKNVDEYLIDFVNHLNINFIILAEFDSNSDNLLKSLNGSFVELPKIGCKKITIFYKKDMFDIALGPEANRYTTKIIRIQSNDIKLLMVAVHLQSKINVNDNTQLLESVEIKKELEQIEEKFLLENTFIIGDFNMNPFEDGMVSASAFNSIPCQKTALKGKRVLQSKIYKYFYNPMWNLFGDYDDNPGTFYTSTPNQTTYYWNILDQVIMRPSLLKYFVKDSLAILQDINGKSLVDLNGKPSISDHLPITFNFNFIN